LGVREKLAAEELIDQRTVQFLSGQSAKVDPGTLEQAIQDYLDEKRGILDRSKESTKHTIQKISGILKPLAAFLRDRGAVYMKDVKTEHLSASGWIGFRNNFGEQRVARRRYNMHHWAYMQSLTFRLLCRAAAGLSGQNPASRRLRSV
jgi:hypothetical protein